MKERAFSPSAARARRALSTLAAWAPALALLVMTSGCPEPADLEHPEKYCEPGKAVVDASGKVTGCSDDGGGSTAGTSSGMGASCETACMNALLQSSCTSCHLSGSPLGGLDLQSGDYTSRLKDQPAKHQSVDNPAGCPNGDKLVDSATPTSSWLLKKVSGQQNGCGTVMPPPPSPQLSQDDVACVTAYVNCVGGGA